MTLAHQTKPKPKPKQTKKSTDPVTLILSYHQSVQYITHRTSPSPTPPLPRHHTCLSLHRYPANYAQPFAALLPRRPHRHLHRLRLRRHLRPPVLARVSRSILLPVPVCSHDIQHRSSLIARTQSRLPSLKGPTPSQRPRHHTRVRSKRCLGQCRLYRQERGRPYGPVAQENIHLWRVSSSPHSQYSILFKLRLTSRHSLQVTLAQVQSCRR